MNLHVFGQLIYNRGGKNIMGEITASSVNDAGKTG